MGDQTLFYADILELIVKKFNIKKINRGKIVFSSLNMYGNPYNFQSFMEQEAVYDISELGNIYRMELFFYQTPKSFKDKNGNLIPYQTITKSKSTVIYRVYIFRNFYRFQTRTI